jgi:hypothetical protein
MICTGPKSPLLPDPLIITRPSEDTKENFGHTATVTKSTQSQYIM